MKSRNDLARRGGEALKRLQEVCAVPFDAFPNGMSVLAVLEDETILPDAGLVVRHMGGPPGLPVVYWEDLAKERHSRALHDYWQTTTRAHHSVPGVHLLPNPDDALTAAYLLHLLRQATGFAGLTTYHHLAAGWSVIGGFMSALRSEAEPGQEDEYLAVVDAMERFVRAYHQSRSPS